MFFTRMELITMKKYIISQDLEILLAQIVPIEFIQEQITSSRQVLKKQLENIFGVESIQMVSEATIVNGINAMLIRCRYPIISVDRVYAKSADKYIEITRSINENLETVGNTSRYGFDNIDKQVRDIKQLGFSDIILVDDVIFSGKMLESLILFMSKYGIRVKKVIAGIVIGEGYKRLQDFCPIESVIFYSDVIDEICERDFYAGIPMSGRNIMDKQYNIGAPYFYPFGKPCEWASIPPDRAEEFSVSCIEQSLKLWQVVEKVLGRELSCQNIDRIPIGAPKDNTPWISYLASLL